MDRSKIRAKQNANLKPIQKGDLSKEELKKRQSNGGKKSVQTRKEAKLLKAEIVKRTNAEDWEEIVDNLIRRAKKNDKSFEVFRDTIGQKPIEEIQQTNIELKPILPKPEKEK